MLILKSLPPFSKLLFADEAERDKHPESLQAVSTI